jgi:hypothetical protein
MFFGRLKWILNSGGHQQAATIRIWIFGALAMPKS